MTEIRFYHLTRRGLEYILPELLEKTLERGWKAVVMASSPERVEALNQYLWTYNPNKFVPHGSEKDGNGDLQPVWLTPSDERPNAAEVLFLTDGARSDRVGDYTRVCEIFDGTNEEHVAEARKRWGVYKSAGHDLSYWQQGDKGWVNATPAN